MIQVPSIKHAIALRHVVGALAFSVLCTRVALALPAFPGAEGFGTSTTGGRGGRVIVVSTLNASGAGSLKEALQSTGPRIIVFRVSGVITLTDNIEVTDANSYVTVLGQSSPGGITITGGSIGNYQSNFHDAVFRFLKIRRQDGGDTFAFNPTYNLVLDHVDLSGSADEVLDIDASHDLTVQWSTVTNSTGGSGQYYATLLAYTPTQNITVHHNLSAHHVGRCGAQMHWLGSAPVEADGPNIDIRNNVYYDCRGQQVWRADDLPSQGVDLNLVGNYAKVGPSPNPMPQLIGGFSGDIWSSGNVYEGGSVNQTSTTGGENLFPHVTTTSAAQAYDDVLAFAGSWPRDAMNVRTINDVKNGTGVLGKIDDPLNTSTGPAVPTDSDKDGIPDAWETANGLNPNNASDSATLHSSGYAYIEVYLNEVAQQLTGQTSAPAPSPPTALTAR